MKDPLFAEALAKGDVLIPDGVSIVMVCKWLKAKSQPKERIAGCDLFVFEMERLNAKGGKCFFMGSSEKVLSLIKGKEAKVYPNITVETYSPPYKPEFTDEDNRAIIDAINAAKPEYDGSKTGEMGLCAFEGAGYKLSLRYNRGGFRLFCRDGGTCSSVVAGT